MEHEYHTSRRDERRAWVPLAAVAALLLVAFGAVLVVFRDDGPADSTGTLPSVFPPPATSTTSTTTTSTTVPAPSPIVTAPRVTTTTGRDVEPDGTEPGGADAGAALQEVADGVGASEVTDIVRAGSARYAMLVEGGDAALYRWDGGVWQRETFVPAPATVRRIDTADVTGDGVDDFVVSLAGLQSSGGVYGREGFGFELLPFNLTSGQVDWVDDLRLQLGRLTSDVVVGGARQSVQWTWTGDQFEVLG